LLKQWGSIRNNRPLSKLRFIPDFSTPSDKSPGYKLKSAEAD